MPATTKGTFHYYLLDHSLDHSDGTRTTQRSFANTPKKRSKNGTKKAPKKAAKTKGPRLAKTVDKKQGLGGEVGVLGVLGMGSKVEINYRGQGKFYPGHVTRASDSGSGAGVGSGAGSGPGLWDVLYDDGDTETGVPAHHLRLLAQVE